MQDARCKMQDARCRMQDARCKMQDAGCKMQDAGCKMQDARCKMQDAGCREIRFSSSIDAGSSRRVPILITLHVLRFTFYVSRFTFHVLLPFPVSRPRKPVKSNDNVTEREWFCQKIMLPGGGRGRTDLKAL